MFTNQPLLSFVTTGRQTTHNLTTSEIMMWIFVTSNDN